MKRQHSVAPLSAWFTLIAVSWLPMMFSACGEGFQASTEALESASLGSVSPPNTDEFRKAHLILKGYCENTAEGELFDDFVARNLSSVFEEGVWRRSTAADGLSDIQKLALGFNPTQVSSTGDGYSDFLVQLFGLAPGQNNSYGRDKAFDGNANTFYEAWTSGAPAYVGRDLGSAKAIHRIRYLSRSGYGSRMSGGVFRGANQADLSDAVTLHTINSTPADGQWQEVTFGSPANYRYVFFSAPIVSVSEIEIYGL